MTETLPPRGWDRALSFYDSLSGPQWAHIPPFRALVYAIAASEHARHLTAITSHEVLTISPYTRYPDWFDGRHVQLYPLPDGTVRVVKRSDHPEEAWILSLDQARFKVPELIADL